MSPSKTTRDLLLEVLDAAQKNSADTRVLKETFQGFVANTALKREWCKQEMVDTKKRIDDITGKDGLLAAQGRRMYKVERFVWASTSIIGFLIFYAQVKDVLVAMFRH